MIHTKNQIYQWTFSITLISEDGIMIDYYQLYPFCIIFVVLLDPYTQKKLWDYFVGREGLEPHLASLFVVVLLCFLTLGNS